MKSLLKGKIIRTDYYQSKYYSIVAEAAPDLYTQPSSFRVCTEQGVGSSGDEVQLMVDISGYCRMKNYIDKSTGEQKSFPDQKVYFNASIPMPEDIKKFS